MSNTAEQLRETLFELLTQRERLNHEIEVLQRAIDALEGPPSTMVEPSPTPYQVPSVQSVVLDLIRRRAERGIEEINLAEVMDALKNASNTSTQESVSSILSRMVSSGLIGKGPHRGTWLRIPQVVSGAQLLYDEAGVPY